MADERDRIEGKGEHFTAKQRVASVTMYARAISTFQAKVNNTKRTFRCSPLISFESIITESGVAYCIVAVVCVHGPRLARMRDY